MKLVRDRRCLLFDTLLLLVQLLLVLLLVLFSLFVGVLLVLFVLMMALAIDAANDACGEWLDFDCESLDDLDDFGASLFG